ncbi:MAG: 1-(5-phosphoribosyl)-5-((5-phosphoribosylamino)methylideneamino)imidazole-4-carboxamide isomerase [Firmicutes bacterium]|nr:1-(5-phosphoribosyl)-5-((5-phosphoribosylamino)methylideneamino)imidazole-4-carboxamide isomerase [Bacillota bacterium]MBO2522150.1 1-(5-phosphoribosyl)-5-((5-phosphoribosylamino)methylideneamino)imidazole-4-carboxamide isomerase [Bacillota bacterium]
MIVIPAIDLKDGRCVRLVQGRKSDVTVYGDDPVAVALEFERAGAERIHVVDLDGAFDGKPKNWRHLKAVVEAVNVPVQTGGGIRSLEAIEELLEIGVERVILGTVALKAPELVREACRRFGPERVLVGIDARGGRVAVEGWVEESDVPAVRLAEAMREAGVREIVFTDISRDGTLAGPNLASLEEMLSTGMRVIASGGVSSVEDLVAIAALARRGVTGAIVGKALYTGRVDLAEAIAAVRAAVQAEPGREESEDAGEAHHPLP